jgi:hypothetical protein
MSDALLVSRFTGVDLHGVVHTVSAKFSCPAPAS